MELLVTAMIMNRCARDRCRSITTSFMKTESLLQTLTNFSQAQQLRGTMHSLWVSNLVIAMRKSLSLRRLEQLAC